MQGVKEHHLVKPLNRFQIEAIITLKCLKSTSRAADALHISYGSYYMDLQTIKEDTGLDPYNKEDLDTLFNAINETVKEVMRGKRYGLRKHFGRE